MSAAAQPPVSDGERPTSSAEVWQRRLRRWAKPPRRLRFTRQGRWYIGFTLFIGFAAINTGNNLLFLLLGLLLAGIVISGVLSESALRGLSVARRLPSEARAGRPALVGIVLTNRKQRIGSYSVLARDLTESGEAGRTFFLKVDAGQSTQGAYRWEPVRRGPTRFLRVELSTRFPFGLFDKSREIELVDECVVFPREVPPPPVRPRRSMSLGERPSGRGGMGVEFFGLREAQPHDEARLIHWRTSARRGRPVVIEREREHRRRVALVVDNRVDKVSSDPTAFDAPAEHAAALLRRAIRDGCEVAFSSSGLTISPGAGAGHERRILHALALLDGVAGGPSPVPALHAEVLWVPVVRGAKEAA